MAQATTATARGTTASAALGCAVGLFFSVIGTSMVHTVCLGPNTRAMMHATVFSLHAL